ncbi:MAG: hypothetical protein IT173_17610 [Acidobacteria bacterium]|nr:hypothetical protein [Acidobacteriota bacterium]
MQTFEQANERERLWIVSHPHSDECSTDVHLRPIEQALAEKFEIRTIKCCFAVMLRTMLRSFEAGDRVLIIANYRLRSFAAVYASLRRGGSYALIITTANSGGGLAAPFRYASAILDRWLYKHAAKIVVVRPEMLAHMRIRAAGLDIPVILAESSADLRSAFSTIAKPNSFATPVISEFCEAVNKV